MKNKIKRLGTTFYLTNKKEQKYFNKFKELLKNEYKQVSKFYKAKIEEYTLNRYLMKIKKVVEQYLNFIEKSLNSEGLYINFKDNDFYLTFNNEGINTIFEPLDYLKTNENEQEIIKIILDRLRFFEDDDSNNYNFFNDLNDFYNEYY